MNNPTIANSTTFTYLCNKTHIYVECDKSRIWGYYKHEFQDIGEPNNAKDFLRETRQTAYIFISFLYDLQSVEIVNCT